MSGIAIVAGGPGGLMTLVCWNGRSALLSTDVARGKPQSPVARSRPVARYRTGLVRVRVAECYAYDALDQIPLRQLITGLGLTAVPTASSAVVLTACFLHDEHEIGTHFGADALRRWRISADGGALLPLASWRRGFGPDDNRHPLGLQDVRGHSRGVPDPTRAAIPQIIAHSDMATEPHLTNGLIGLRNFLKSVPVYGAQYSIEGGMEMLPGVWQRA